MARRVTGFLAAAFLALALGAGSASAEAAKATLQNGDCVKCHAQQPADIDAGGGKHKTEVGCQDCHAGHRPSSKNNIPACGQCHDGGEHYKLPNCLECHKNPHTPKNITFDRKQTVPCLTCHKEQIKQLKDNPSKHTALACSFCHDVHGKKPNCTQCHKPHAATMTAADCSACHKAHQPKNVVYQQTVQNALCGSCHTRPASLIAATATKHAKVSCVQCHKDKHKMVPNCSQCHESKHPAGIMKKFPNCLTCHNHPHDLNNFAAAAKPAAPAPAAAPAKQ
ncbi:MAG TPA: cytochrome c3 family protein [bacterium]